MVCRENEFIERVHADAAKILKHYGVKLIPPGSVVRACDRKRDLSFSQSKDLERENETTLKVSPTEYVNFVSDSGNISTAEPKVSWGDVWCQYNEHCAIVGSHDLLAEVGGRKSLVDVEVYSDDQRIIFDADYPADNMELTEVGESIVIEYTDPWWLIVGYLDINSSCKTN